MKAKQCWRIRQTGHVLVPKIGTQNETLDSGIEEGCQDEEDITLKEINNEKTKNLAGRQDLCQAGWPGV